MTNPQKKKKKQEIIEVWTNLKHKLSKLVYLEQNKGLIKDALEIYLNQSSSFTSFYSQTEQEQSALLRMPSDYQITLLTEPTVPENDSTGQLSPEWQEYLTKKNWNSYLSQKEKNEKIVRECKELLSKLEE